MRHADMVEAYPGDLGDVDKDTLVACIGACYECAQACTACADACLAEDMVAELATCIRTDLDCVDVCLATGNTLSRRIGHDADVVRTLIEACAAVCKACAEECARHSEHHEHCRICAEACRCCEQACRNLLAGLG